MTRRNVPKNVFPGAVVHRDVGYVVRSFQRVEVAWSSLPSNFVEMRFWLGL